MDFHSDFLKKKEEEEEENGKEIFFSLLYDLCMTTENKTSHIVHGHSFQPQNF